ncbi:MAG: (Fe-S)-binding protein [Planctomycetes bacterium]|nr:(Fe-S)-binding protein [Planctomycetota bacterium]
MWNALKKSIDYCTFCPKLSRFVCPVALATRSEATTPTSLMTMLHLLRAGTIEYTAEAAANAYECTGCRACTAMCEHSIDVPTVLEAARAESVRRGVAPDAVGERDAKMRSCGNPFGVDLGAVAAGVVPERLRNRRAAVGLYFSCSTLRHSPDTARATIKVFEALGVDFGVYFPERWCCGYPSLTLGCLETFDGLARAHRTGLAAWPRVVGDSPACVSTVAERYGERKAGLPAETRVEHVVTFLEPLLAAGKLKPARMLGRRVAYHDPCYLARRLGEIDGPRRALAAATGAPPLEFRWNRRDAQCCGAGGGLPVTDRGAALEIARLRVEEFRATGADELVSACPSCVRWLGKAGAPARDLITLLAEAL